MGLLDDLFTGGSGALLGAGAAGLAYKDISNRLGGIGTQAREGALAVGEQARRDTQFQPFHEQYNNLLSSFLIVFFLVYYTLTPD